ncbi:MAG: nucleotidyltransferase family protein [Armatimonadetes bacterium]|nr:nucleotidyltransferase family protein [Armatimonadota bacterium]
MGYRPTCGEAVRVNVGAIVLAAGASRRMGQPKALIRAGGRSFLEWVVDSLCRAGVARIVVVTRVELLAEVTALAGPGRVLVNPRPEEGMLSTLRVGLNDLPPDADVLLAPVDQPAFQPASVRRLLEGPPGKIVVPSHAGRRGHPALYPASVRAELLDPALEGGARAVLRRDPARVVHVEVDDPGVLLDANRPEELPALVALLERRAGQDSPR